MASKTEQAMQKVATFLYDNPEPSGRAEIQAATGLSPQMTGRALATLVDSKAVVIDNTDGTDRWVWAQRPEPDQDAPAPEDESPAGEGAAEEGGETDLGPATEPEAEASGASEPVAEASGEGQGEATGPVTEAADPEAGEAEPASQHEGETEVAEQAAEVDGGPASEAEAETAALEDEATPELDGAESDRESGDAAEEEGEESEVSSTDAAGVNIQPVLLEHDPMVMYMARALADASDPLTTRQVAEAAYMPMGTREVLTALRALHAAGLATCSKPFAPADEDCTWQRQADLEADAFMRSARGVPMSAAPDRVTCPTCGHSAAIPGVTKPRKRNSDLRSDGSRKLPAGGLKRLAKEWLTREENSGEQVTPGQLKRELRAEHGDQVSKNCDGALRQLMAEQFTKKDPTDNDKRPLLVEEEDVTPLTYRIRDLA